MGSFWMASRIDSWATSSGTPPTSKRMRPGLTTATKYSGEPFPLPMRVSAGFIVIGLFGKIPFHTFSTRFKRRGMAIRAASIWRRDLQPASSALMPKSPKASCAPRWAVPLTRPFCILRNLVRLGINMALPLWSQGDEVRLATCGSGAGAAGAAAARAASAAGAASPLPALGALPAALSAPLASAPAALTAAALGRRRRGGLLALRVRVGAEVGLPDDLAVEDPHLHAGGAVDRVGRGLGVVDVGAEGVEGDAALHVLLGPAHLGAAEAAGQLDAHALGAHPHRRAHGLLHRAAERDAALELLRDVLRDEAGVELGPLDLV